MALKMTTKKSKKVPQPIRGELWFVNLDPTTGREQAKTRPCLVISVDIYNSSHAKMITVVPLTSTQRNFSWYVEVVPTKSNGLKKTSYVISDQIRTISKNRMSGSAIGFVDEQILQLVEDRIRILLQL